MRSRRKEAVLVQHQGAAARGSGGGGRECAPWVVLGLVGMLVVGGVALGLGRRRDAESALGGEGEWPNDGEYPLTISDAEFERRARVAETLRTSMIAAEEPMGQTRDIKVIFTDGSRAIFKEDPPPEANPEASSYLDYRIDYQGWSEVLAAHLNDIIGYYAVPVTVRRRVAGRTGALIEWVHWDDVVSDPGLDLADLTDRFIFGYLADDKDAATDRHRKRLNSHTYASAGKHISKPLHLDNGLAFILLGGASRACCLRAHGFANPFSSSIVLSGSLLPCPRSPSRPQGRP